jgi:hypothetical protein
VDFLNQIAAVFRVQLIGAGETADGGGVIAQHLLIEDILPGAFAANRTAFFAPHALFGLELR